MKITERFINLIEKRIEFKLIISISIISLCILLFQKGYMEKGLILSLFAVISALCFYLIKAKTFTSNWFIWVVYAGVGIIATLKLFLLIRFRIDNPAEWDFAVFYLFGKVAANGYNFYSPQDFHTVFNTLQLPFTASKEFTEEIVNVGFWYPPQTIFYFLPLSAFSFKTALTLWTIIQTGFLFGCIYLIYNLFLKAEKFNGLLFAASMVLLYFPLKETILCSQTNFILLFYLLLMFKYKDKGISGFILALAIVLKPYMVIFIFAFIFLKNWKSLLYFITTSIIIFCISLAFYGLEPFITYLINNPTLRIPAYISSELINQSLKGVLLRFNSVQNLPFQLIFSALVISFLSIAGYTFYVFLKHKKSIFLWPVLLTFALIVYPATLSHYGVLLLFPFFQLLNTNSPQLKTYISVLFIVTFFVLGVKSVFLAICFCLLILFLYSLVFQFPHTFYPIQSRLFQTNHEE